MGKTVSQYKDHIVEMQQFFTERRVLLVSQGNEGPPNAMAIGWGMIGIIWNRPIFSVLVRPSRYTHRLIEQTGEFTINIVPPQLKDLVEYCGTASGRDHDKFKEKGLTAIPSKKTKTPIIKECILHFECKVVCKNDLVPSEFIKQIVKGWYTKDDFHRVYFSEIIACQCES